MAKSQATTIALFEATLENITRKIDHLEKQLAERYALASDIILLRAEIAALREKMVTQDQYWPVKNLVLGGASVIFIGFMGAFVALVVR
jgi:hypothetical protein